MDRINIDINEQDAKELLDFYHQKQEELRKQMIEINKKYQRYESIINQIRGVSEAEKAEHLKVLGKVDIDKVVKKLFDTPEEYNCKWSWGKKAHHALQRRGKASTARQLFEYIKPHEPELEENERTNFTSFSASISAWTKSPRKPILRMRLSEDSPWFYALRSWIGVNGELQESYLP